MAVDVIQANVNREKETTNSQLQKETDNMDVYIIMIDIITEQERVITKLNNEQFLSPKVNDNKKQDKENSYWVLSDNNDIKDVTGKVLSSDNDCRKLIVKPWIENYKKNTLESMKEVMDGMYCYI